MLYVKPLLTFYLAGGISSLPKREDGLPWREEALQKLAQNRLVGICPMTHGVEGHKTTEEATNPERQSKIVATDANYIYRTDGIIVNMDVISFGTAQEMFIADQVLHKPVFAFNNKSKCSSAFFYNTIYSLQDTLDDVITAIHKFNAMDVLVRGVHGVQALVRHRENHYQVPYVRHSSATSPEPNL